MKFKQRLCFLLCLLLAFSTLFAACAALPEDTDVSDLVDLVDGVVDLSDPTAEDPASSTDAETTPEKTEPPTEKPTEAPTEKPTEKPTDAAIAEDGVYTSKEDVALYIHTYGKLPSNFITKKEAEALGWTGGSLEKYAPGKCIGGSRFGNYEGLLPTKKGRTYTECDIDTLGKKSRGAKRIVFSNDGLIYYTDDHYETFTLLYGEE